MKDHLMELLFAGGDAYHRINDPLWKTKDLRSWLKMERIEKKLPAPVPSEPGSTLVESGQRMNTENKIGDMTQGDAETAWRKAVGGLRKVGDGGGNRDHEALLLIFYYVLKNSPS